jgi:hypothetical protein
LSVMRSAILLLALLSAVLGLALGASPPGVDEELYCPASACLKEKSMPSDWLGPREDSHLCCTEATGQTRAPFPWGVKVPQKVKDALLVRKWHMNWCAERHGECGAGK